MRFHITFDLPELDFPQREYQRDSLRFGRLKASQMANALRDHLQLKRRPGYFLYVWEGEAWLPHYEASDGPR